MAVNPKLKKFYFSVFETPEICAANAIQRLKERRALRRNLDRRFKLTEAQKKAVRDFWRPYANISTCWARYYVAANGQFDPRYIPNDLCYTKIDQYFNDRKLGYGFNDKNYYSKIFAGIKQPEVAVRKINGLFFDAEYNQLSAEEAKEKLLSYDEIICKPSQESGSGRGIFFLSKTDERGVDAFLAEKGGDDYVAQKLVRQHTELDKVHKGSLNCLRICSLLQEDGVHILSAVLRMGFGSSRVDNATAKDNAQYGGVSCGIDGNGRLRKFARAYYTGKSYDRHPDGLTFEGFQTPSYEKATALVKKAHPLLAHFRLTSWDIAIDEVGDPVLIEANMRKGGINFHQFNNGPLFGDLTESVLDEVFHGRKK